ncbi:MAG TPA: tetratricopeptide repeat protein [Opitutaceae bacterium]|nr:tetratricopeptide repeat protein [Opitutaceae bacterium]
MTVLVLLTIAAYSDSFRVPFFFDDRPAILRNATIRQLWPIGDVLQPPPTGGVSGRPIINLSLALNYAVSGMSVPGYHLTNLAIHLCAGLTLFGIVRRTLRRIAPARRPGTNPRDVNPAASDFPALAVAGLWLLHPLQTETVTCIVQRTESIVSLFYLLTLYCFIRGAENPGAAAPGEKAVNPGSGSGRRVGWHALAVLACLLGMGSKEVMVSAPLMVLLYDRTFLSGSFRAAWHRHGATYLGLAGTWLLLAGLVVHSGGSRGNAAGFGLGVTPWSYAFTQCEAVVHYLRLAFWPYPLVVDYGGRIVPGLGPVLPQAVLLLALLGLTLYALWRRPAAGFFGAWFFGILAPSSSIVPLVSQTMAEHRMYLPLAAVIAGTVMGIDVFARRASRWIFCALILVLGLLTYERNQDYRSEVTIWTDTVARCPGNLRARNELGNALVDAGRSAEAIEQYEAAMQLAPDDPGTRYNLGLALARTGRMDEAIKRYTEALRINPLLAEAHNGLGNALVATGQTGPAMSHYREAIRLKPAYAEAHYNLGVAFFQTGQLDQSRACFEEAVRLDPGYAEAHNNLGSALFLLGRREEAIAQYEEALRLAPNYTDARNNLMKAQAPVQPSR